MGSSLNDTSHVEYAVLMGTFQRESIHAPFQEVTHKEEIKASILMYIVDHRVLLKKLDCSMGLPFILGNEAPLIMTEANITHCPHSTQCLRAVFQRPWMYWSFLAICQTKRAGGQEQQELSHDGFLLHSFFGAVGVHIDFNENQKT